MKDLLYFLNNLRKMLTGTASGDWYLEYQKYKYLLVFRIPTKKRIFYAIQKCFIAYRNFCFS
jgi:hypothetical protein